MEILRLRESSTPPAAEVSKPKLGRFRPWLAALFTLLLPGLGQIFNRQPRRALLFWLAVPGLLLVAAWTRLLHSYGGFVFWVVLQFLMYVGMVVDAFVMARRQAQTGSFPRAPRLIYFAAVALIAANLGFLRLDFVLDHVLGVRAFRIPANSMKPTLLKSDRLIADMKAFSGRPPARGDVVIFDDPNGGGPWVKRVIGVPGDEIAGDVEQIILNGKRLEEPYILHDSDDETEAPTFFDGKPTFGPIRVPEGRLFLVGDNRYRSLDSRFAQFGLVDIANVRGRPLYLYNAEDAARIGQKIH